MNEQEMHVNGALQKIIYHMINVFTTL